MANIAQDIVDLHDINRNYNAALESADTQAIDSYQDYGTNTSCFIFRDNSQLQICEVDFSVICMYGSM